MIKYKRYAAKHLSTGERTSVIIGGEGNFCAERFGCRETAEGLFPCPTPVSLEPQASFASTVFAQEMPSIGYSLIINGFGQFFRWDPDDPDCLKKTGMLARNVLPIIVPYYKDGVNSYAAFGGNRYAVLNATGFTAGTNTVKLYCGTAHAGRIFARDFDDPHLIRWSGYDYVDWSEKPDGGGHLRLSAAGGEVLFMTELGGNIVLVRERGLTVIHVLADARHMRVEELPHIDLPAVTANTCVICGGQLYFYTRDGLYSFNGATVNRAELNFWGLEGEITYAKDYMGRYIFFTVTSGSGASDCCFLVYDVQTGESYPMAKGCCHFFLLKGEPCCMTEMRYVHRLTPDKADENRRWQSKVIDLGTTAFKTLKSLTIEGDGAATVEVDCDGRKFSMSKNKYYPLVTELVMMRGRKFVVTVSDFMRVTRLTANWEVDK